MCHPFPREASGQETYATSRLHCRLPPLHCHASNSRPSLTSLFPIRCPYPNGCRCGSLPPDRRHEHGRLLGLGGKPCPGYVCSLWNRVPGELFAPRSIRNRERSQRRNTLRPSRLVPFHRGYRRRGNGDRRGIQRSHGCCAAAVSCYSGGSRRAFLFPRDSRLAVLYAREGLHALRYVIGRSRST